MKKRKPRNLGDQKEENKRWDLLLGHFLKSKCNEEGKKEKG